MISAQELAAKLSGRQYRSETTREEERVAKVNGLVIVFGASDDLMELRGAVDDELGAYEGTTAYFTRDGLPTNDCGEDDCPYFAKIKERATRVTAIWDRDGYSWTYETAIPHATFEIMEDDEKYCRGIVFALADVPS